jgi:hypothetical protein
MVSIFVGFRPDPGKKLVMKAHMDNTFMSIVLKASLQTYMLRVVFITVVIQQTFYNLLTPLSRESTNTLMHRQSEECRHI